jgi:hypothetical protein
LALAFAALLVTRIHAAELFIIAATSLIAVINWLSVRRKLEYPEVAARDGVDRA